MSALGLNQQMATKRVGIPQPKVSGMMGGDFTNPTTCLATGGGCVQVQTRYIYI